ncbi:hypothetical protein HW115_19390 [Verrucomicrobiaceae bacterium N1E253]|uniref:Uncharacterized protein n=1 Tax=Oceaniferula marina TaxID=2748318 RepID=A0A851GL50_9BACT|nr:hypothetical protein [Oceaniferula marina]NWK57792.1 hypothetical protein [Oceaniferula marina]
MKIISSIIAILSFIAGIACIFTIPKYAELYADSGVAIPKLIVVMINTSGWIPGGIFLLLSVLLVTLIFLKAPKISAVLSVISLLLLIGAAVIIPTLLLKPLSQIIEEVEHEQRDNKKAEQVVAPDGE